MAESSSNSGFAGVRRESPPLQSDQTERKGYGRFLDSAKGKGGGGKMLVMRRKIPMIKLDGNESMSKMSVY